MTQRNVIFPGADLSVARLASTARLALCAALLGCADESINMGEGLPVAEDSAQLSSSRCADSTLLAGPIVVRNQEEVDALAGCQVIDGDLSVMAFEGANLRALHALSEVRGTLRIGDGPYPDPSVPQDVEYHEEYHEELQRQQELNEAWLSSLEGLEALQRAGALLVTGLTAEDVRPLTSLQSLTERHLMLQSAPNLKSLDGLQSLAGLRRLVVVGARRLTSLDGLTLPDYMSQLHVEGADLRELEPIGVSVIDDLHLADTQLEGLEAFANLTVAGDIALIANRELRSLAGLNHLEQMANLAIEHNIALTEAADFARLRRVGNLRFVANPLLASLPSFPALLQLDYVEETPPQLEQSLLLRPDVIQIFGMDALSTLSLPAGLPSASLVRIENNPNLRQIEFTSQVYIEYLSILDNPLLEGVSTGALDKINVLNLADNPLLSTGSFDGVRRLDTTSIAGNGAP
jgi:hypothetical protein